MSAQKHMLERISALLDVLNEEEQEDIRRAMGLLQRVLVDEERGDRDAHT